MPDERSLLRLINDEFPKLFLREARIVAHGILDAEEQKVRSELDRYAQQICSPDLEGLLAADRRLAELDYRRIELSIAQAEAARLYPHVDEDVAAILIDGMPELVRLSPTQTRFVGALPADVPAAAIARDLGEQGISFAVVPVSETAADVTALAKRLVSVLDEATPAGR